VSRRAFAALLRLYPSWYRARYGDGMTYAFMRDLEASRARGPLATTALWGQTVLHSFIGASLARWPALDPTTRRRQVVIEGERKMNATWLLDLRDGWRGLRAARTLAAVAVLSLGLGIGSNTAIFSMLDALVWKELPVRDPARLVLLDDGAWTNPIWEAIRAREHQIADGIFAFSTTRFNLAASGPTEFVDGVWVSGAYFEVLGVDTILGRPIQREDDQRGGGPEGPVAVISHRFWQAHFGGAADVVGTPLSISGVPFTVVGVAPAWFYGVEVGRTFDVMVPIGAEPLLRPGSSALDARSTWWLRMMARLEPGQTVESANARIRAVQDRVREETVPGHWTAEARSRYLEDLFTFVPAPTGLSTLRNRFQMPLQALLVVVGLVLLIACGNVANLLLARATTRRHEFSLRLALGASRWRVARQLLSESALLAAAGAAVGLVFARWTGPLLVATLGAGQSTPALDLTLDLRVLAFTAAVAAVTTFLFGLAPALGASRLAPGPGLQSATRGSLGDPRGRFRSALVVMQLALSLTLVVAAGLFAQTFARLATLDLGFEPDALIVASVNVPADRVEPQARLDLFRQFREAVAAVPGVAQAATSFVTPVSGSSWNTVISIPGRPDLSEREMMPMFNGVSPGWFETYGTPLLQGRDFDGADKAGSPRVVIVNEAFVSRYFGAGPAVGRIVREMPLRDGQPPTDYDVVGVVADAIYTRLREPVPPTMYVPLDQYPAADIGPSISVTARAARGAPAAITRDVVTALSSVRSDAVLTLRPLSQQIGASITQERVVAILATFFGGLALLLAAVGLYGITSQAVSERRRELGLRLALGAEPAGVVRLVLGRVAGLVTVGVLIGLGLSLWGAAFIDRLLFGLAPRDPITLVGATLALALSATLAGLVPARRAASLDPARVLRDP